MLWYFSYSYILLYNLYYFALLQNGHTLNIEYQLLSFSQFHNRILNSETETRKRVNSKCKWNMGQSISEPISNEQVTVETKLVEKVVVR